MTANRFETDLIHRVWEFLEKCFDGFSVKVYRPVKRRATGRIKDGTLRMQTGKLQEKCLTQKSILHFRSSGLEYGCVEAGLSSDLNDTKAINEGRFKLPRTMKDIFNKLVLESPSAIGEIKVGGFLMTGLQLTAYILDSPAGKVCRITKAGPC
ncbi:hypothetical protein INT45_011259 [Circinella minor]|uniref:Uncharacterized protein n=1 Tax=Circinella minor TaxID=1195481 RepID=A0A8H7VDR6_9FUNG|nr:hypothetical protein INT45_011259 [Circinella minor]